MADIGCRVHLWLGLLVLRQSHVTRKMLFNKKLKLPFAAPTPKKLFVATASVRYLQFDHFSLRAQRKDAGLEYTGTDVASGAPKVMRKSD